MTTPGHRRHGKIVYVGLTSRPKKRHREHERDALGHIDKKNGSPGRAFANAIRKYGFKSFELVTLEWCPDYEVALEAEQRHIIEQQSLYVYGGYNETPGGERNYMRSPYVRAKMRVIMKEVQSRPELRAKHSAASKGRVHSKETRQKISLANKGKPKPKGFSDHLRRRKGMTFSDAARQRMSNGATIRAKTPAALAERKAIFNKPEVELKRALGRCRRFIDFWTARPDDVRSAARISELTAKAAALKAELEAMAMS